MRAPRIHQLTVGAAAAGLAAVLLLGACGDDDPAPSAAAMDATNAPDAPMGAGDATSVTCIAANDAGDAGAEATAVEISGFTFRPGDVEIDAGTAVTFSNADGADHSVWSADQADGEPAWLSVGSDPDFRLPEVLHEGDASACTFVAPGTYEYLCGVHNSMTGTVVVR